MSSAKLPDESSVANSCKQFYQSVLANVDAWIVCSPSVILLQAMVWHHGRPSGQPRWKKSEILSARSQSLLANPFPAIEKCCVSTPSPSSVHCYDKWSAGVGNCGQPIFINLLHMSTCVADVGHTRSFHTMCKKFKWKGCCQTLTGCTQAAQARLQD